MHKILVILLWLFAKLHNIESHHLLHLSKIWEVEDERVFLFNDGHVFLKFIIWGTESKWHHKIRRLLLTTIVIMRVDQEKSIAPIWFGWYIVSVQDWSPHMSFISKGSQISTLQLVEGFVSNPRRSSENIVMKLKNSYEIHAWIIQYTFLVQCEELKINHLTPLLVVTIPYAWWLLCVGRLFRGLQVTFSFSFWGCVLEGCFERCIFWRAKSRLKGIEDFNLEHWW
jgi:hypothetical protein